MAIRNKGSMFNHYVDVKAIHKVHLSKQNEKWNDLKNDND